MAALVESPASLALPLRIEAALTLGSENSTVLARNESTLALDMAGTYSSSILMSLSEGRTNEIAKG